MRKNLAARLTGAPRQIGWLLKRGVCALLGRPATLVTSDRLLLEGDILPYFGGRADVRRVLFVGCDWYTHHYQQHFRTQDYWTYERNPNNRRYGAAQHVTDCVTRVGTHFPEGHFDVVVFNGVLGWGLNDPADARVALGALADVLAVNGVLVVGWDDSADHRVLDPVGHVPASLAPWPFPGWGTSRRAVPASDGHTFDFFRKV